MRNANNRLLTLYVTKSDRRLLGRIFKDVHKLHRSSFSLECYLTCRVKELSAIIGRFALSFLVVYIVSWLPVIPSIFISEQEGFIKDNWGTISATLLSVGAAIYLGMIALIPFGVGKGNEIFGVKRFDIFWHQPLGKSFYNDTIFYEFTFGFIFLIVSYFIGNIFLEVTAFFLHFLLALLLLSRVIRFAKLTDFEVFANYLTGQGFARNRRSREIMENRAYMVTDVTKVKESVAKRTAKSLTDPYIALSFHMIDEMERMIQRDVSIKTEQNIFEDLFRKSLKRRNGGVLFYQCLMAGHYLDVITSPPFKSENAKPLALSFEFLLTTLEDILCICRRPDVVSLKTIRSLPDYCALHEDAKRFHYEFINLIKIRLASYFALQWIARETKDKIDVDESLGFLKERASSINAVVESNIAGITELLDEVAGITKREIKKLKMIILRQLSSQQKEYDEGSTAYVAIENMKKTIIGDGSGEQDTLIDASLNNQTPESKDFLTD